MSTNIHVQYGQKIKVATDVDGYPAVRIEPSNAFVWDEDEVQWVGASSFSADAEDKLRELAATLVQLADQLKRQRIRERAAGGDRS